MDHRISLPILWTIFQLRLYSTLCNKMLSQCFPSHPPRPPKEGPGLGWLHSRAIQISVVLGTVTACTMSLKKSKDIIGYKSLYKSCSYQIYCVSKYRIFDSQFIIHPCNESDTELYISARLVFPPFWCLAETHLMTKHKLIEIVNVTCIDTESIYLCVWLNLCINRLPSANLIWILVAGMESSIRTGALRMDFSSSSGEEGVLTISGVRL